MIFSQFSVIKIAACFYDAQHLTDIDKQKYKARNQIVESKT
jgi:hypothetical protein